MPIRQFFESDSVFGPEAIQAMSDALERTCKALQINGHAQDREIIATRILDLARDGDIDAKALSDRVIEEMTAMQAV